MFYCSFWSGRPVFPSTTWCLVYWHSLLHLTMDRVYVFKVAFMCTCVWHSPCMEVRRQLAGVGSLPLPWVWWVWQPRPLLARSCCQPAELYLISKWLYTVNTWHRDGGAFVCSHIAKAKYTSRLGTVVFLVSANTGNFGGCFCSSLIEIGESNWHLFSVLGHAETVSPNASSLETGSHTLADIVYI